MHREPIRRARGGIKGGENYCDENIGCEEEK